MSGLRRVLGGAVSEAKSALTRANVLQRVARQTGMTAAVTSGGLVALLQARGRTNASITFRYHAKNTPHRPALVYGERSYSFFELNEQMDRTAAALRARGIGPGDRVLLMLTNVPEFIFVQAGVGRLGAGAVAVSWRSTANELRYLLQNSGARAIFFAAGVGDVVKEVLPEFTDQLGSRAFAVRGSAEGFETFDQLLASVPSVDPDAGFGDDNSDEGAVIVYTSGTTGKPKGAVRRFNKDAAVQVLSFIGETPMRYGQTHLTVCPLYHSTAFGFLTLSYILGSTIVLLDGFAPDTFLDALERHRVDHTAVVPTMLHRVLELGADAVRARDLSALKAIFTGGAPLSGPLALRVMDAFGDKLYNFYGATETGLVTLAKPHDLRAAPGTIGRAVGGNELRLLDERGREVPSGSVGELYVRSGNLVAGYHANDKATADSMREGFFSVGDLARADARGYFYLEGRKREMIISAGVNVYPREVESALATHPSVGEAAVVGIPDDEFGERVHAFVELRSGVAATEDDLLAHCREHLSGAKRPRGITIVPELPRNPTGKVLKRELRDRLG